ncbi:MAG: HAD hydrolase-like protein [Rhodospirillales bacterium]|nr:HAD hydrolase-like protein [Rhodospirillales bacterium]
MGRAIFDLDGTLVDSAPGITGCYRAALAEMGYQMPPDIGLPAMIGPPLLDVCRGLLARFGDTRADELARRYRALYLQWGWSECALYPGIDVALAALAGAGAELHVATAKRTVYAARMLDRLGIAARFASIRGSEDGGAFDDKAVLVADVLRGGAGPAAMVGDSRFDIAAARANAIPAVAVAWGYGQPDEHEGAVVATEAGELPGLISRLFLEG